MTIEYYFRHVENPQITSKYLKVQLTHICVA